MSKFKKGDIVRITAKERQLGWNTEGKMNKYIGMLVEVDDVALSGAVFYVYDDTADHRWVFKSEEAELVYRPSDSDDRYEDGLNDAWEAAKYMLLAQIDGGCSSKDLENMFGTLNCADVFMKHSPKEVIKILADYKQKHMEEDDMHVGDEVEYKDGRTAYVLVPRRQTGELLLLMSDYAYPQLVRREAWHKTGYYAPLDCIIKEAYAALVGENEEDEQ